jgi:hypothetical protein
MAVYFIAGSVTGLIKIGKSTDVIRRLRLLQIGSPDRLKILAVIKDQHSDAPYHTQFRTAWEFGEWFRPSVDLLAFIKTLPEFHMPEGYRTATNLSVNRATPRQHARTHESTPYKPTPYEPTQIRKEFSISQVCEEAIRRLSALIYQRPAEYVAHPEEFNPIRVALVQQIADEYRGAHATN